MVQTVEKHQLEAKVPLLVSPVYQVLHPSQLAEWLLASGLDPRPNIQMHKTIWGEEPGR